MLGTKRASYLKNILKKYNVTSLTSGCPTCCGTYSNKINKIVSRYINEPVIIYLRSYYYVSVVRYR